MRYYCRNCHSAFDEPKILSFTSSDPYEPTEELECCPICGSDENFTKIDECPRCGGDKPCLDNICTNCRTKLIDKFRKFRDNLHGAEIVELDDMLDGNSIEDI